ncbi:hypothetical protein ACFW61_24535 [Streptomyces microflavus]|uniref:hypothetical protein n=1 Tax=Streptomyces microflavus TaxID=1919 RepID=UPI003684A85B
MSTETNPVAQYKTLGGATITIAEQSGVYWVEHPTEHGVRCNGCDETHVETWGFDAHHDEFGEGPQPNFDPTGGEYALPAARRWAQSHAETCRALPTT